MPYQLLNLSLCDRFENCSKMEVRSCSESVVLHTDFNKAGYVSSLDELFEYLCSRSSRQFQLREQARTLQNVMLMQESVLHAEEEGDYWTGFRNQRPGSPLGYALAVDCTAAKMIESLIERCKLFHSASLMHREECTELVATLESLHEVLQAIQVMCTRKNLDFVH